MSRQKRSSQAYDAAIIRKAAMVSIDPALDLGNGLTLVAYQAAIDSTKLKLDDYNTQLSVLDGKLNLLKAEEKKLRSVSERMLGGVATKFSNDSDEYEKAGGTKKSETKKRVAKPNKNA